MRKPVSRRDRPGRGGSGAHPMLRRSADQPTADDTRATQTGSGGSAGWAGHAHVGPRHRPQGQESALGLDACACLMNSSRSFLILAFLRSLYSTMSLYRTRRLDPTL